MAYDMRSKVSLVNLQQLESPTLKDVISAICMSHDRLDEKITNMERKMSIISNETKKNQKSITKLERRCSKTESQVDKNTKLLNYFEQKELSADIIITSVPTYISDAKVLMRKLNETFEQTHNNYEFTFIRPIKTDESGNSTAQQIITRFKNIELKQKFMQKVRRNGPIIIQCLFPDLPIPSGANRELKIHINDRLTAHNANVMKEYWKLKTEKKIQSVMLRNNRIVVKLINNKTMIVYSLDDIAPLQHQQNNEPGTSSETTTTTNEENA